MAEFLQGTLRANETAAGLEQLAQASRARAPKTLGKAGYTTLPDGRVLDGFGKVVYTPKVVNEASPR